MRKKGILIYGGTFNPLHIGHLRVAIEAREALDELVERVDFVPVKLQPLKNNSNILPFAWRMRMIQAAIGNLLNFACSDVENLRPGPSYTYDTLKEYPGTVCRDERYFLMGSEDFKQLEKWHRGLELPDVANLVIVPRDGFGVAAMREISDKFWPGEQNLGEASGASRKNAATSFIGLHNGGKIYYLNIPYLEISSTAIRNAWLNDGNIAWLVPEAVRDFLEMNRLEIASIWKGKQ